MHPIVRRFTGFTADATPSETFIAFDFRPGFWDRYPLRDAQSQVVSPALPDRFCPVGGDRPIRFRVGFSLGVSPPCQSASPCSPSGRSPSREPCRLSLRCLTRLQKEQYTHPATACNFQHLQAEIVLRKLSGSATAAQPAARPSGGAAHRSSDHTRSVTFTGPSSGPRQ